MSDLILRNWNGRSIRQRADGFISATDMCQASGKYFGNWSRLDSTKEYLEALRNRHYADMKSEPIEINEGGSGPNKGPWVDRRVALRLAQWISPAFALQVDEWIEELLTTGTVTIAPEPTPQPKQISGTSLKEWADLIAGFPALAESPMVMSALQARVSEELSAAVGSNIPNQPVLLTVRANQLGCHHAAIGNGTQLGKRIVALGFEPVGKEQHGRYQNNAGG